MTEYNQWAKCVCGHQMSMHRHHGTRDPEVPHPCRACDCENFLHETREDA